MIDWLPFACKVKLYNWSSSKRTLPFGIKNPPHPGKGQPLLQNKKDNVCYILKGTYSHLHEKLIM